MNLSPELKNKISKHALSNPEEEVCGFIYKFKDNYHIFECINEAKHKHRSAKINGWQQNECAKLGEIVGFYHSHPKKQDYFSPADKKASIDCQMYNVLYYFDGFKIFDYKNQICKDL